MCWRFRRPLRVDGRLFPGDRQCEEKLRSAALLTLDPDLSAVRLDDSFRNGQPEAGAEAFGALGLPVRVENILQVFLRNSGTCVRDREQHVTVLGVRS